MVTRNLPIRPNNIADRNNIELQIATISKRNVLAMKLHEQATGTA